MVQKLKSKLSIKLPNGSFYSTNALLEWKLEITN
jgi:hypothetical protein